MSVLIKGMDMPKSCGICKMHFLGEPYYVCCGITDRIPKIVDRYNNSRIDLEARKASIESVGRPQWCPLVEIQKHGRLIDADALKAEILRTYECEFLTASGAFDEFATQIVPNIINNAPTVIEAEK